MNVKVGCFLPMAVVSWVQEAAEYWTPLHLVLGKISYMLGLHRYDSLFVS